MKNNFSLRRVWVSVLHDLRSAKALIALIAIVLLILGPVVCSMSVSTTLSSPKPWLTGQDITKMFSNMLSKESSYAVLHYLAMAVAAFISSLVLLSYIKDKKSSDFFHSLPVRRDELFAGHYLAGLLIFLVPFFLTSVLTPVMMNVMGAGKYVALSGNLALSLQTFWNISYFYVIFFTLALLASLLTGTRMSSFLLYSFFTCYTVALIGITVSLNGFFDGRAEEIADIYQKEILYSTPVSRLFSQYMRDYSLSAVEIVLTLLLCAGIAVLGAFLYRKRKCENASLPVAFEWLRYPLQYLLMLLGTLTAGLLFYYISDESFLWMIIGFGIGGLLSFLLLNIIFSGAFSALFVKIKHLGIFYACFAVFFLVFVMNLPGIYRLPDFKPEDVGDMSFSVQASYLSQYNTRSDQKTDDPQTVEKLLSLYRELAENSVYDNSFPGSRTEDRDLFFVYDLSLSFTWKGRRLNKSCYYLTTDTPAFGYLEELFNTDYRDFFESLFWDCTVEDFDIRYFNDPLLPSYAYGKYLYDEKAEEPSSPHEQIEVSHRGLAAELQNALKLDYQTATLQSLQKKSHIILQLYGDFPDPDSYLERPEDSERQPEVLYFALPLSFRHTIDLLESSRLAEPYEDFLQDYLLSIESIEYTLDGDTPTTKQVDPEDFRKVITETNSETSLLYSASVLYSGNRHYTVFLRDSESVNTRYPVFYSR